MKEKERESHVRITAVQGTVLILSFQTVEKISTIRTNNTTSYMGPILQQYTPIRLPGSSAKVTYTSKEPTVFTAP